MREDIKSVISAFVYNDKRKNQDKFKQTRNEISIDDYIAWIEPVNTDENNIYKEIDENSVLDFWDKHKSTIIDYLEGRKFKSEDLNLISDAVEIIRWKFFMNKTFKTVNPKYQEISKCYISLLLQFNAYWIENYLWYFNPESAYYKRVKALTLFRLLESPKEQIESVRNEVCELLYNSTQCEDWDYKRSENILKEYIERVFNITRTTYDSRIEFISEWDSNWDVRCWNNEFVDWLWKYINWEKIDSEIISIEEDNNSEEIENLKSKLREKENEAEQIKKEQEAILLRQKELEDQLNKVKVLYNEDLKKKELENAELQAKILLLQQANEISKQSEIKEETTVSTEDLEEKRSHYRILVVWWSDKANKKYNYLLKNWFNWELYNRFKINPEQLWELYGDYNKQKTQKDFAKKIENDLWLWNIDFVIALQTDHETWLYKLLNNSEFWSRITYFAEREENNQNPKYSNQSFSEERFYYYLERALNKYERAEENSLS